MSGRTEAIYMLEVKGLSKSFPGVQALADIRLEVEPGSVHALMGENGAGKSTLMKILIGLYSPDGGEIRFKGRAVRIHSPHEARRLGLAMIHQELLPFPDLSVAENIFMGQQPVRGPLGWIDRKALHRQARLLLERLGVPLDTAARVRDLTVAQVQTVEIAKALAHKAELIIMDEPTSAISDRETEALFGLIGELKEQGVAIIYITHKMDEVFRIADTVTVLRDGRWVACHRIGNLDQNKLINLMVGRELDLTLPEPRSRRRQSAHFSSPKISADLRPRPRLMAAEPVREEQEDSQAPAAPANPVALAVRGLSRQGRFRNISFEIRRGEILGLAGLMGAGRTDLARALFGLAPADGGHIHVHGPPVRISCPAHAIAHGIGLVSEDRKQEGLVLKLSVEQNLTLSSLRRYCRCGFLNRQAEREIAEQNIESFAIKTTGRHQIVHFLSGGNQQKVVLAKTLLANPAILILDEPTRGIDIGSKAEVYAIIRSLASQGKALQRFRRGARIGWVAQEIAFLPDRRPAF